MKFAIIFFLTSLPIFAMEETAALRYAHRNLLQAPISELSPRALLWQQAGETAEFRIEEGENYWYLLVIPEINNEFHVASPGSYVIRRNKKDGSFSQLKIFLSFGQRLVARITPQGEASAISIFIDNHPLYRDVTVRIPFAELILLPFAALVERTRQMIDWNTLLPDVYNYQNLITMVNTIRAELPFLPDAEDGAMDEYGNLVLIESLKMQDQLPGFNCSGFVKWIGDGLYYPAQQRYLAIAQLKNRQLTMRGSTFARPFEEKRDPYFGLDWSRNLAHMLQPDQSLSPEAVDVRNLPIAQYREDIGYAMAELSKLLYWLAINEPGYFYLASFNKEFGSAPVLRQHVHLAAVFPYIDERGTFHTVVMERNVESSLDSLERRYQGDFVHLVRIRASSDFSPPRILAVQ